jgi:hypothetical protein
MRIDVMVVKSVPLGVDTPEDLEVLAGLDCNVCVRTHDKVRYQRRSFSSEPGKLHLACRGNIRSTTGACPTFGTASALIASDVDST